VNRVVDLEMQVLLASVLTPTIKLTMKVLGCLKNWSRSSKPTQMASLRKCSSPTATRPVPWRICLTRRLWNRQPKIATMMRKEIKKQMKWQVSAHAPNRSCHLCGESWQHDLNLVDVADLQGGGTRWSYTIVVPHVNVMKKILRLQDSGKEKAC
jgi:hypothetical protein